MNAKHNAPTEQSTQSRRAKAEAVMSTQRRAEHRRRLLMAGAVATIAVAGVALTAVESSSKPNHESTTTYPAPASGRTLPPWPAPTNPEAGMKAAGLISNPMEGAAQHIHAHLDILVNGHAVEVPADLGIDTRQGTFAELHTHDASGILHVESGSPTLKFNLGQLFVEWGVKLDAHDLGGLHDNKTSHLSAYVNGHEVSGDPSHIQLANHEEIALVYGSGTPANIPDTYDFAAAGL